MSRCRGVLDISHVKLALSLRERKREHRARDGSVRPNVEGDLVINEMFSRNSDGVGADAGELLIARTPLALRRNISHLTQ